MAVSYNDYKNKYGQKISKKRNEDWEKNRKLTQEQNAPKTVPNTRVSSTNDIANNLIKKRQEQVLETVKNKQRTTPINASRNFTLPVAKNNPLQQMNDTIEATKKSPLNDELKKVVSQNTEDTKWNKIPIIAGKTIGNTSAGITRGLLDTAERVLIDAPMTLGLSVAENIDRLVNGKVNENRRKKVTNIINRDLSTEAMEKIGWTEEFYNEMEKDSLITRNNIGGKVVEGIGGMIPSIMTGGSSKALSYAVLGARSFGGGSEEALSNYASTNDAILYGIGKSATEIATEWLTGGIPGVKGSKGGLDKLVARGLGLNDIDEISRSLTKEIIKSGYKMVGEAGEEALTEIITPILKNATYSQGEKVDWNAVMESAIIGGITGGVLNAPADISNYRTSINGANTISNQNNIETSSINQNEISLPSVETTNQEVNVQQNLEKLSTKPNVLDNNIVLPKVKYQVTLTENPKINNFRQSVSNYFDNTPTTHDLVNTIEKIINDKDYNVLFDDTIVNKKGETVNAQITNNNKQIEIKINPNSERAGEFLLMHEITHAIETDSMKQLVMNYASKNAGFNEALENLKRTYGTTEVTDEVLADISGQLFGNQEFINSLTFENTTQSKSMIKKIYESIMKVLNKLTTKGRYRNFVQDLEVKWREAYRNTTTEQAISNLNNETRYAQKTLKDGTQYIETEKNLFIKEDGSPMSQREIYNSLVGKKITFNDGITATIKQWLPNNKNMYNELFKRYPNYKNVNDIKSVNKNINENIIELLENSDNISPNEPDYMNRHKDNKISSFDTRKVSFYDGKNAYDLDFSIAQMQDGNYVAYAKRNLSANNELLNKIKKEAPTSKSRGVLPYVDNITQNNNNVNSDISSTKYSMQENQNNTQDNQGRTLTKEQQEYFKDSKVRDENGNLLTMYHGTSSGGHTVFDPYGGKPGLFGQGSYFTDNNSVAESYTQKGRGNNKQIYEVYLNIINPIDMDVQANVEEWKQNFSKFLPDADFPKSGTNEALYRSTLEEFENSEYDRFEVAEIMIETFQKMGYDGITHIGGGRFNQKDGTRHRVFIAFESNQIKNIDNTNPTSNDDIRYSQQDNNWQKHLEENYESTGTKTDMNRIKLPTAKNKIPTYKDFETSQYSMQQNVENDTKILSYKDFSKVMNPNEISQLTMEDANTTPLLPKTKRNNQNANEESSFYKNITEKSKFLTEENRGTIGNEEDVQYYKGITNEDTLNEAKTKLDNGGMSETLNWFNRNKVDSNGKMKHNPTAVDVAEGWILLKQYQDAGDYDSMVEVAKTMREIGTQAGQTVQAYNIMARLTPEGMVKYAQSELSEAYEQMCKNKTKEWIDSNRDKFNLTSQEVQAIIEIMEKVQTMEDGYNKKVELAKIQKIMTDKLPPERGAGIKTWMRISMLFNPKTQVRNVMGNAVIAPVNYFSDLFSSAVDSMVAKKTGYRTTGVTNIGNYVKGFKKGAFESYNDFKEGINTRNIEGNRFEITEGKSFNDNTSIGKALNKVDSLLGFMLDAGDRTFYEATFTNSINNQMKLNNTDTVTQEMIDIATQEALSRTWQDNNNYTKFVLNVRKMMNNINVKGYGLGDVLIPFAKTPANLTKAIVDYSPLGLMQTINDGINLKKSLSNGQYNAQMQHKFVQDLGKATAGTMLYVLGYALAKAGITSGESDDDKDVANFMKNTLGVSSYSIKIGNKTFTYDWAQPLAAPLSITSNIVQKQKENATLYDSVISSLDTAGNILLEQSFMESISTVLNNNEGIATGIQEAILELPSRAIPTLMKQITDLTDVTQRTTFEKDKPLETAFNKIKAKIPGLSKTLAPTKDTLGRNVKKYGGKNNIFNVFVNPANVNTENISKSAEEIYRVYKATGEKSIMPRVPEYKYKDEDGNEIILNSQQRAEYQEVSGKIIEDNIEKLLNTTEYKKLTDIEKAEILNNIVNYSYNVAKKEVLDLDISQTYAKAYEYSEIGNVSDYYTFKANIDDTDSDTKKESISSYLINSNLNNKQLAYLYGSYYSSEETLNSLLNANIPIKEFIKFNSQKFEGDFNTKTGKTISGSRENKVINYVNSLNLSIPQKALLIKMEYKSFKKYDRQIAEYVNSQNISFLDKAQILKKANFTSFDKQIINYVNSQSMTVAEKTEILEDLGFTVKNGRVY